MATTRKKSVGRPKTKSTSSSPRKKSAKKAGKNKLGVKNSLVNNINAKKKKGTSKPGKKSSVSKKAYKDMESNWDKNSK